MPDEPRYVTRREYYSAIGTTMNMIGIVTLVNIRHEDNLLREIGMLVMAIGAIVAGLMYTLQALREKPSRPDSTSSPRGPD